MTTSKMRPKSLAANVKVTAGFVRVTLADGREIAAPLDWFPRLKKATPKQRKHWRLIGGGVGIHWEEVDEDISIAGLLRT